MKNKAFTMIEVMMALLVVSIMLAVLAPTITTSKVNSGSADVQVIDSTPVGIIVAWWGTNYPEGWIPVSGQFIDGPEYESLRRALGGINVLPNLNEAADPNSSTTWIIKAVKK